MVGLSAGDDSLKRAFVGYIHYLGIFLCFVALLYERIFLKENLNRKEVINMIVADIIYGLAYFLFAPTITYVLWAIPLSKNELPIISDKVVKRFNFIISTEFACFAMIPFLASLMAIGIGLTWFKLLVENVFSVTVGYIDGY